MPDPVVREPVDGPGPSRPAELFSIAGRIAFVSGASAGIGRHVAAVLARAGAAAALSWN